MLHGNGSILDLTIQSNEHENEQQQQLQSEQEHLEFMNSKDFQRELSQFEFNKSLNELSINDFSFISTALLLWLDSQHIENQTIRNAFSNVLLTFKQQLEHRYRTIVLTKS